MFRSSTICQVKFRVAMGAFNLVLWAGLKAIGHPHARLSRGQRNTPVRTVARPEPAGTTANP